jgi:CRISPR-associated protein Csm4
VENPDTLRELGKELKRISYLDPQGLREWVGDEPLGAKRIKEMIETAKVLSAEWDPIAKFGWYTRELRPRVSLDRASSASAIWHCGLVRFHKDAGLYGLVRVADEEWRERLESAFRLLGDMGLGGERTYGMGVFRFSGFEPLDAAMPELANLGGSKLVLLSSYFPNPIERSTFSHLMESWDFFETRGYVVSGRQATKIKRKRLRMVACGSVARKPIRGSIVDVTPEPSESFGLGHRVYRSGLAFTVPEGGIG